jgi:uncharacterized delta-60 repeat protein
VPSAGFLDPTFNGNGLVVTPVDPPGSSINANAVAVYPPGTVNAGKIVLVGHGVDSQGNTDFRLVRYLPNGSPDSTFGNGGIVNQSLTGDDGATGVALVGDKILASGWSAKPYQTPSNFVLARFNSDGSLDQSFGTGGWVQTSFQHSPSRSNAMALQADGKIVLAGTADVIVKHNDIVEFAVARYNANGTLDTTFGNKGEMTIDVGEFLYYPFSEGAANLALAGDKIDLVGEGTSANAYVVQLTAAGQLDKSFGVGGVLNLGYGTIPSLTAQPDGRLVVASNSAQGIHVTRLLTNGSLDTGFATGGTATVPQPTGTSLFLSTAVQVDPLGRFVIGGYEWSFIVIRLTPTGALDSTFGSGGIATAGNQGTLDLTSTTVAMALQADGKTVLVGTTQQVVVTPQGKTYYPSFFAARFTGDSALQIGSFTASPNPVTAASSVTLTASNLTDTNPGATITQVALSYIDNSGNQHLLGYAAQTSPGVWTLSFSPSTFSLTSGTYTLLAQAEDSYGVFSDPFALPLPVQ